MSQEAGAVDSSAIRPFTIDVPEEQLEDLRRRIAATRWPTKELVADRSQGVQLATMRKTSRATGRATTTGARAEAKLNALSQFTTEIDGVEIHFIHVKSRERTRCADHDARLARLGRRAARNRRPADRPDRSRRHPRGRIPPGAAVHARLRLLRRADRAGWNAGRVAQAWAELMRRLGYTRYVAQGGDVGAAVTDLMGRQAPEGLLGIHTNLLVAVLAIADQLPAESEEERAARDAEAAFRADGFGYFLEMATRPQTIGYALLDSPVAMAAWMLDHDTDSYYKFSRAFVDGEPVGNFTREHIVDNITTYWLTGTGASTARSYWEDGRAQAGGRLRPARLLRKSRFPVAFTSFPGEISSCPRAVGSSRCIPLSPTSTRSTRAATSPRGGAGALLRRVRAAFSSLR